jgi:hypothetical protein
VYVKRTLFWREIQKVRQTKTMEEKRDKGETAAQTQGTRFALICAA